MLARARLGDGTAKNRLLKRLLPVLRRWAHGRLPANARGLIDTEDLVQVTLIRTFSHLDRFEPHHPGAIYGYLRTILVNQIIDATRKAGRRPQGVGLEESIVDPGPSPLESAIGRDALSAYEAALERLSARHRLAVFLRLELGLTFEEIARELECPTPNAARLLVTRALTKLAEILHDHRPEG